MVHGWSLSRQLRDQLRSARTRHHDIGQEQVDGGGQTEDSVRFTHVRGDPGPSHGAQASSQTFGTGLGRRVEPSPGKHSSQSIRDE
jgi:hypothetical protein